MERGYWSDQFIKYFYRATERRSPEISRGIAKYCKLHFLKGVICENKKTFTTLCTVRGYMCLLSSVWCVFVTVEVTEGIVTFSFALFAQTRCEGDGLRCTVGGDRGRCF